MVFGLLLAAVSAQWCTGQVAAPEAGAPLRVGVNYARAGQPWFPIDNESYVRETRAVKLQLAWTLRSRRRLDLELLLEPGAYRVTHRMLHYGFIQEKDWPDFEARRERFLRERRLVEVVLNVGVVARVRVAGGLSAYGLASVGPMVATRATERLPRGFAFSDVVGLGLGYRRGRGYVDVRASLRHSSNAGLRFPNHGHNAAGWEVGVGWRLR